MDELVRLTLETMDGRPLMHKFYRQDEETSGLLIGLPGGHYGVDGPLLYYPSELLRGGKWDSFVLTYGYVTAGEKLTAARAPDLLAECEQAIRKVLSMRSYPRVGLVGKSLGAGIAAYLCQQVEELQGARAAYLTPVLGTPLFDPVFASTRQPAYMAIGSNDRYFDEQALQDLQAARDFKLTVIDGADHGMDVRGDLQASLQAVKRVVAETVAFLRA
jgi:dienelactone hydrolase